MVKNHKQTEGHLMLLPVPKIPTCIQMQMPSQIWDPTPCFNINEKMGFAGWSAAVLYQKRCGSGFSSASEKKVSDFGLVLNPTD